MAGPCPYAPAGQSVRGIRRLPEPEHDILGDVPDLLDEGILDDRVSTPSVHLSVENLIELLRDDVLEKLTSMEGQLKALSEKHEQLLLRQHTSGDLTSSQRSSAFRKDHIHISTPPTSPTSVGPSSLGQLTSNGGMDPRTLGWKNTASPVRESRRKPSITSLPPQTAWDAREAQVAEPALPKGQAFLIRAHTSGCLQPSSGRLRPFGTLHSPPENTPLPRPQAQVAEPAPPKGQGFLIRAHTSGCLQPSSGPFRPFGTLHSPPEITPLPRPQASAARVTSDTPASSNILSSDKMGPSTPGSFLTRSSFMPPGDHAEVMSPNASEIGHIRSHRSSLSSKSTLASTVSTVERFLKFRNQNVVKKMIWNFLEDPESSYAARCFSLLWDPFIVATCAITAVQTLNPSPLPWNVGVGLETCFDVLFTLEVIARFCISSHCCSFFRNIQNLIDLVAAVPPLALRMVVLADAAPWGCEGRRSNIAQDLLLCAVPVLRVLKTLRRFQEFHLFLILFRTIFEALHMLLFALLILVLSFSCVIYLVEPRANIQSVPQAMWLAIVTVSTLGYGDVTPQTGFGTVVVAVLVICSVLYMAMPIGIIGNAFTKIWQDRDRILLMIRTHDRLVQWGYVAADLVLLFKHFDADRDGDLSIDEFRNMINEMQIGLSQERIADLFDSIDKDGSGGIDAKELVHTLFPQAYHEVFGKARTDTGSLENYGMDEGDRDSEGSISLCGDTPKCKRAVAPSSRQAANSTDPPSTAPTAEDIDGMVCLPIVPGYEVPPLPSAIVVRSGPSGEQYA